MSKLQKALEGVVKATGVAKVFPKTWAEYQKAEAAVAHSEKLQREIEAGRKGK